MFGFFDGPVKILNVLTFDMLYLPAVAEKAGSDLFGKGQVGIPFDSDLVIKIEVNQVAQAQMPGQRSCFGGDSFHEVTI